MYPTEKYKKTMKLFDSLPCFIFFRLTLMKANMIVVVTPMIIITTTKIITITTKDLLLVSVMLSSFSGATARASRLSNISKSEIKKKLIKINKLSA